MKQRDHNFTVFLLRLQRNSSLPNNQHHAAAMSKQTTSKLAEGVSVTVTQHKNPPSIAFEIENQLFVNLDFTLDITGSKNLTYAHTMA